MKDSKNLVIGMLCAVVCVMAVAYAAFSTTLTVNGTVEISSSWCTSLSISCSTSAVTGGQLGQTATGNADGSNATFTMGLIQPGDTATCIATVTNCGNIPAKLNAITSTISGTAPITFSVTPTPAQLGSRPSLAAQNSTETVTVVGTYDASVTTQPTATTKTISIALNYVQA